MKSNTRAMCNVLTNKGVNAVKAGVHMLFLCASLRAHNKDCVA
jgi:hypothetical protein